MPTAPCFFVKEGDRQNAQIDLEHFPFTIGRARECDFVIDATEISRIHIELDFDYQQVVLRDLGSTNGTYLNGERLQPHKDYRLRANDVINLADNYVLIFDDPATTSLAPQKYSPYQGLRVDDDSAQVYIADERIDPPLSPSQIVLLQLLIKRESSIVSREEIRRHVWGPGEEVSDQTIDALVSRLRKRLKEIDDDHDYIVTRRGFGLMFTNRDKMVANTNS